MKKILTALSVLASALSVANATSVFSDPFGYGSGGIVTLSSGVWENNTGTAGSCLVTNDQLYNSTSLAEDIGHKFTTVFETNGGVSTLYSSFTVKFIGLPSQAGTYFAHFSGTNAFTTSPIGVSGFRARVFASRTNFAGVAGPGQFFLSIANSGLGNATNGQWATPLDTNVTYTVVTRYVLATGISTLWINPALESDTSVTASDPVPDDTGPGGFATNGLVNISHYGFRQGGGQGTILIDDLKIVTSFSDFGAPTISPIPNQATPANTPTDPIPFTVEDNLTQANSLTVSNSSSNPTLITNIVIANADAGGTNRTITLTPQAGQQGSATITIYASDGLNTSSTSFILRVGVPSIADIPNQITYSNVPLSGIPVTISDTETAASSLTVKAVSSNPTLITNIVLGGSSSNRTVSLTPESAQTGVSTITVFVDDGINTNSTSFVLSVSPRVGLLLSDTFSYDTFDIPHALYLASFGSTNSPWQHASGNFTHQLQVTNGMAQLFFTNTLGQTNTEDLAANLTNGSFAATPFSVNSGAILYVAFTLNQSLLPSQAGDYFAHFKDTSLGTTFRAKIFASTTNAAPGSYRLGIANAVNTVNAQFPMDLNTDQAYLVVVRYNTATAESVLWVNPTSESSTYVSATDAAAASSVGSYGLREEGGIGIVNIDNLVIGTAFTEVVPVLSLTKSGNNAVLSWGDPSYALQASTNVLGVYTNIPGATSPHSYPISGSQRYFRLNR